MSSARTGQPTQEVHQRVEDHSRVFRDLVLGFVKIHVLFHASVGPVYGARISEELERHGYRMSWGTLYPLLHNFERDGLLAREERTVRGKVRKYYAITDVGRRVLDEARQLAVELVAEIAAPNESDVAMFAESEAEAVGKG